MKERPIINNKYLHDYSFFTDPKRFGDLILYQIGEIYVNNDDVVTPHVHGNFFELTYVLSGKGIAYADNEQKEVSKHDIYISLPYEKHEIISDKVDPIRYFYIAFSFDKNSEFYDILFDNSLLSLSGKNRVFNSHKFTDTFTNLITAFESSDLPFASNYFELSVKLLTIDIFRIYHQIFSQSYQSPTISGDQNLYYRIMNYIDRNLTKIDKLTDISNDLNYNYVYISRIFKHKFGESIYNYYSNKKLELAKKLIAEGKMSITEISEYLNYSSIYVFSRIFKKRFGISPNTYKQQIDSHNINTMINNEEQ